VAGWVCRGESRIGRWIDWSLLVAAQLIIDPPDLPALEPGQLAASGEIGELSLVGVLVERAGLEPLRARHVQIKESELRGVKLDAPGVPGLSLIDVVLRDCDLSNVDGRGGLIRRVECRGSRLVGFGLSEGKIQDLRVVDCSLMLVSFAFAGLRSVVFERVNLTEASFMQARLEAVQFIDCKLGGADFRGAKLRDCVIRGSSLDEVLGVESLCGVSMPWSDVVASAAAMASALGIAIESD
jgi:uncharacterized protein YjbI with pentapeptide repeats